MINNKNQLLKVLKENKEKNINLIKIDKNDKINEGYMKTHNFLYTYKFVVIINEILEV